MEATAAGNKKVPSVRVPLTVLKMKPLGMHNQNTQNYENW